MDTMMNEALNGAALAAGQSLLTLLLTAGVLAAALLTLCWGAAGMLRAAR